MLQDIAHDPERRLAHELPGRGHAGGAAGRAVDPEPRSGRDHDDGERHDDSDDDARTPPAELTGTVNFSAVGLDYPSVAAWLKMISQLPSLAELWVPNITKATLGSRDVVNFTSTAALTPKARSDRLERYRGTK